MQKKNRFIIGISSVLGVAMVAMITLSFAIAIGKVDVCNLISDKTTEKCYAQIKENANFIDDFYPITSYEEVQ